MRGKSQDISLIKPSIAKTARREAIRLFIEHLRVALIDTCKITARYQPGTCLSWGEWIVHARAHKSGLEAEAALSCAPGDRHDFGDVVRALSGPRRGRFSYVKPGVVAAMEGEIRKSVTGRHIAI